MTKTRGKGLAPGRALELEALTLLQSAGFRAHSNPGTARPRQTDIVAHGHDLNLLIEVKDRKRPVDVGDIDSLRARLGRTAHDFVGILFTTGSISDGAIKAIESDRTREILVFASTEIALLREKKAQLSNLIAKKRSELRIHGRVWFRTATGGEYLGVGLPSSNIAFSHGSETAPYFCAKTGVAHAAFALYIADLGWSLPGGEGVRLSLTLSLSTVEDLRDLFGYLHDSFGLSASGAFTIHQSDVSWHGVGIRNFIEAVQEVWPRYRAAPMSRVHHSEDLIYIDEVGNGWVSLYARQRVPDKPGSHSFLHDTRLCFHLPGVPVDPAPYIALSRYTGNASAEFAVVHERRTQTRRLKKPIPLQVMGTAVRTDVDRKHARWIVGLIARNPFFRKKRLPRELETADLSLHDLRETELLLCYLRDHIEHGDQVDRYFLEGVEATEGGDVQIIRPFGTWNKLINRIQDDEPDDDRASVLVSRAIVPVRRRPSRGK